MKRRTYALGGPNARNYQSPAAPGALERASAHAPPQAACLSIGHNSTPPKKCYVETWQGTTAAKFHDPRPGRPVIPDGDPPTRGNVTKFSNKSRRRLLQDLAKVITDTESRTCALTLPGEDPGFEAFTEAFKKLQRVWANKWPQVAAHWKREPQKRGAMHMHLIVYFHQIEEWEIMEFRFWLMKKWHQLIGNGDPKHLRWHIDERNWQPPRGGLAAYFAKYIGKIEGCEGTESTGRWWGKVSKKNIPYGDHTVTELTPRAATMVNRWARKLKKRKAEIAKRKAIHRKIFGNTDIKIAWEDLCNGHGGAPNPKTARELVLVFKQMAKARGTSWERPTMAKHGSVFLVCHDAPGVAERLIEHALSLSRSP